MEEIKVSVVMAVYNAERYLRQALGSVCAQTLKEIEIICVDDGSTDGSMEILKEFAGQDDRIKILQHLEKTDGAAAARNMGLQAAKGEYLSFLDADDWFEPDMLEKAYEKASLQELDVLIFDAYVYREATGYDEEAGWVVRREFIPEEQVFAPAACGASLFRIQMGAAWNILFRRTFIQEQGISFASIHHTDDQVFVYLSFALARRMSFLPERLLHYRKDVAGSQSANAGQHPEAGYMGPWVLKQELEKRGIYKKYWKAVANLALEVSEWHLCRMANFENFAILQRALQDEYLRALRADCLRPEQMTDPALDAWQEIVLEGTAEDMIDHYYLPRWLGEEAAELLHGLPWGKRIALYGAGDRGKQVFKWLFGWKWCSLATWVDRDYERIGFPVRNPETLRQGGYDAVVVAVESVATFRGIRSYLMGMGIQPENIIWLFRNM